MPIFAALPERVTSGHGRDNAAASNDSPCTLVAARRIPLWQRLRGALRSTNPGRAA